ncbi:hypothetical protein HDU93_009897 [Gonapodya sp. JEL0774]|nr:hypothetical protein HDU93_009897 [Gonapodya sp. JEL0774]
MSILAHVVTSSSELSISKPIKSFLSSASRLSLCHALRLRALAGTQLVAALCRTSQHNPLARAHPGHPSHHPIAIGEHSQIPAEAISASAAALAPPSPPPAHAPVAVPRFGFGLPVVPAPAVRAPRPFNAFAAGRAGGGRIVSAPGDIHVVFLVDISGSMSSQINGVKSMISFFSQTPRPGLHLHLHTFTESYSGCYVTSSPTNLTTPQLAQYVDTKLKLSCPPDMPGVNASGGDGPENHAAGIASLTQKFSKQDNVVCFLITDAEPHYKSRSAFSQEAKKEKEWLTTNGYPTDIFKLLHHVVSSLTVTFIPILYTSPDLIWFTQLAGLSSGLLLFPSSNDASALADALHVLLGALQARVGAGRGHAGGPELDHASFSRLAKEFRVVTPMEGEFMVMDEDKVEAGSRVGAFGFGAVAAPSAAVFGFGGVAAPAAGPSSAAPRVDLISPEIYTRREDAGIAVPAMIERAVGRR